MSNIKDVTSKAEKLLQAIDNGFSEVIPSNEVLEASEGLVQSWEDYMMCNPSQYPQSYVELHTLINGLSLQSQHDSTNNYISYFVHRAAVLMLILLLNKQSHAKKNN